MEKKKWEKKEAKTKEYVSYLKDKYDYNLHPDGDYLRCDFNLARHQAKRKKKYKSKEKQRFLNFKYAFESHREPEKILRWLFLGLKFAQEKGNMSLEEILFLIHLDGLGYFRIKDVDYYPFSKNPMAATRIKKLIKRGLVEAMYFDKQEGGGQYYKLTKEALVIIGKVYQVLSEEDVLGSSPVSTPSIFISRNKGGKWRDSFVKYNEKMGSDLGFF